MVSLKKLLKCIIKSQIDAYYLLIIKFDLGAETTDVNLVEILDYLEFTHFDSGPGQIMLRETRFYSALDCGLVPPSLTIEEKARISWINSRKETRGYMTTEKKRVGDIMGWTLTNKCPQILKQVINHTMNIQSKDFERLPYPAWVSDRDRSEAVALVESMIDEGVAGRDFSRADREFAALESLFRMT